ncbi:MAG TPA: efflux transporter outer membrane subunit [Caulobacteraceae bacterium]|nr:efflux transporter outer membrane subunit [Caulobacteraceae bacterium]
MTRRAARPAAATTLALLAAACTVGPNYKKPDLPTPATYAEAQSTPRTQVNAADADLSAWWTQFHDPVLDRLITRALTNNPDVQTALSRVRESRQVERQTAAAEYPSLSAGANVVTFRSNRSSPSASGSSGSSSGGSASTSPAGQSGFALPTHLNLYSVGFDSTWEVDLFGGTRRAIQQARANTQAQEWELRDVEVTLTAEVANDYLTLRAAQARIAIGEAELARQRGLFTLVRARRQTGFVTNLDVNQQSTAVATAAAQIPQLQAQARTQIHAIGVLLGEPPEALSQDLSAKGAIPPPPPMLPLGLPSQLLERRPDVREAERRLAAATAGIGVQTANLYPKLTLYPFGSFASNDIDTLFDAHSLAAAGLARLTQPIFDAGKRIAAVRAAREEREQALIAYKSAVLGSLRDVEDALTRYENEESRRMNLIQAADAARGSLKIAQDQYTTGFVPFINVYQSENALLNAEDQLTQSDAAVASDLVSVYKALGGGWRQ